MVKQFVCVFRNIVSAKLNETCLANLDHQTNGAQPIHEHVCSLSDYLFIEMPRPFMTPCFVQGIPADPHLILFTGDV